MRGLNRLAKQQLLILSSIAIPIQMSNGNNLSTRVHWMVKEKEEEVNVCGVEPFPPGHGRLSGITRG